MNLYENIEAIARAANAEAREYRIDVLDTRSACMLVLILEKTLRITQVRAIELVIDATGGDT